ncbi:MAG: cytochrome c3 family protein [bacterium]
MRPKILNDKTDLISLIFLLILSLIPFIFIKAIETTDYRRTMLGSAHDLNNPDSTASCLNCHWMHQRGERVEGYSHSLISQYTRDVCFVCHSGLNPNLETAALKDFGYIKQDFLDYKPKQFQGVDTVHFSGQIGKNPYDIKAEYGVATASAAGSFHMFYSTTGEFSGIDINTFSCFDCHNHGIYESTLDTMGGRLPRLIWSKGSYANFGTTITKADRKDINKFYATEYYCLSCHSKYGYPDKWKTLTWDSARRQLNDTFFLETRHSLLERYGIRSDLPAGSVPEPRNPYGFGNDISCFVCHSRHASAYPSLMRGDFSEVDMCMNCHYGAARDSTYAFTYIHETSLAINYITAGHYADKGYSSIGHVKDIALGGPGVVCTDCHNPHGTGHYKMVKGVVKDPRFKRGDTTYDSSYNLETTYSYIYDLDSLKAVSGFCGGACHNKNSPANYERWYALGMASYTDSATMPSYYRGLPLYDSSKHKGVYNSVQTAPFILSNCSACHDAHGTVNKALLWQSEEELCFQCHFESTIGGAPDIKKYFDTAVSGNHARSHHPIFDTGKVNADQSSVRAVECINCHNPHLATKQYPTIYPYNWSLISDYSSVLNTNNSTDHENRAKFCSACHSETFPKLDPRIYPYGTTYSTTIAYPPGVRINAKQIGNEWFGVQGSAIPATLTYVTNGHFKFPGLIDCINCHSPHGSSNPSNIRDEAYLDPIDSAVDNFISSVYVNFGNYQAFYNENTKISRKFCYTADTAVTYGCHTPQYLTTQVTFPDNLQQDSTRHRTRRVPFGPIDSSYYIDEHDPYWDTNTISAVPPSGILGCSVCHYLAHNPTPDYWYVNSAKGVAQNCLDCHHPAENTYSSTTAKFYGGAPTQYESPYVEFVTSGVYPVSTTYVSKHLASAGINDTTSNYCKQCHGEHVRPTRTNPPVRTDEYHDVPGGGFIASPDTSFGYATTYLDGQTFCLACHRGASRFGGKIAPNVNVTYESAGHGRLGRGDTSSSDTTYGIKVYCFDCHTKHSSQNPKLLRTKIRDLITYSTSDIWTTIVSNRQIRAEDLDTGFNYVSVRTVGYQAVCFACHSLPGSVYDSSIYYQNNAWNSNPGTKLWLGKTVYESAGHGNTFITPYAYVDTAEYGTTKPVNGGMKCSWCHEPHGRGTDSTGAFNSTFNDDMLEIGSTTETGGNITLCYKCHNKVLTAPDSSYSIANIKALFDSSYSMHDIYSTATDTKVTCLNCHNPHTGNKAYPVVVANYRTDVNAGDDAFCISCHLAEGLVPKFSRGNPPPDVEFPKKDAQGEALTGFDKSGYTASAHGLGGAWCRTCHKPHGTMKLKLLREVYDFNQDGLLGGHSYDTIYTTTRYGTTDYREEDVCFGCHRNHDNDGGDWNTAWAGIPDVLQFYQIFDTVTKTYGERTRSHHNVYLDEQRGLDSTWGTTNGVIDDTRVECESCHNQHKATKSQPLTDPDSPDIIMSAWGDSGISFCLRCHDNEPPPGITGLTDEKYKNILKEYGKPDINGIYPNFTGHYRQIDGKPLECRLCHSMHGSNYSKQIQDAMGSELDTFKMMRNMRSVALTDTSLGGNDTLALSTVTEICLSCHSGKSQFYDRNMLVWRDIPIAPPPQRVDLYVNTAVYHPRLLDTSLDSAIYIAYADTGLVRKKVKSVYSTVFNIDDTTVDAAGCNCHGAHNPYKAASNEFSNCFNCHNGYAGIPDQQTPFDTGKFRDGPAPLIKDDNTLLLLHLNGSYDGESKEGSIENTGLAYVAGKYDLGLSFQTTYSTTKLAYPLWTTKSTGAPGQIGRVQHVQSNDLTLRFNNTCNDEDAGGQRYINSLSTATGVSYVEGYIPGITGAVYLGTGNNLTCSTTAAGVTPLSSKKNIDISDSTNNGSVQAWVRIDDPGTGIQDTTTDRYIFIHATTSAEPFKNAIFLRHSNFNTWDIGVSDETGVQYNIVSAKDELTAGWHHIAGTWSKADKQLKIYIDGVLVASEGALFFPKYTSTTFRIGSSSAAAGAINTALDEFQISNNTKPGAEILADYNGENEMNFSARRGTLAFWVKPYWNGNDSEDHTFFESNYDTNNYFRLQKTSANNLTFTIRGRAASPVAVSYSVNDTATLPAGIWSHIAASWEDFDSSRSKMKLYLNGIQVNSIDTATMMVYTDTAFYIGSLENGTQSVKAAMDEVWITDIMQDTSIISSIYATLSNTGTGSTTSPTESYLPNPTSLTLLLSYDTTYNGASGEQALNTSNISRVSGKFDSGLSISGNGTISYLSGNGYSSLALANGFNNSLGIGVLDSTGPITWTQGFLGGTAGGVLIDSSDVLSYNNNTFLIYYYYNDGTGIMKLACKETINSTPPDSTNLGSQFLLGIGSGSSDQAQAPDIIKLSDERYRIYYGYSFSYYQLAYKETINTNLPDSTSLGSRQLLGIGSSLSDRANGPNIIKLDNGKYRIYYFYNDGTYTQLAYKETSDTNPPVITNIGYRQLLGVGDSITNQAQSPSIIRLPDNKYRIYYAYNNNTFAQLAYRETNDTNAPDSTNIGSQQLLGTGTSANDRANAPYIIQLSNGYYRIYYQYYNGSYWQLAYKQTSNANAPDSSNTYSQPRITIATGGYSTAQAYEPSVVPKNKINAKNGTIQVWVNINSGIKDTGSRRYIVRSTFDTSAADPNNSLALFHDTDAAWKFTSRNSTTTSTVSIADNLSYGWHNFAATWDTSALKLYIDGELQNSVSSPNLPDSTASRYYVGCGGGSGQINTALDELLIDGAAKTQSEIRTNIQASSYNFNPVSGTVEMWMKPINWTGTDTTKQHYLFDAHNNSLTKDRVSLYYDTTKEIKFDVYSSTGVLRSAKIDVSTFLDSTTFRHYAGTWDQYSVNLYINGILAGDTAYTAVSDQRAVNLSIGSSARITGQADAIIDEVRIFDVLRDDAAIKADAGGVYDYKMYFANSFDPYDGGSRHPINMESDAFDSSFGTDVSKMECLKCHLQLENDTTLYHRRTGGLIKFVNVDSSMVWNQRTWKYDNSTKANVTKFCLSCHMRPDINFDTITNLGASGYTFSGSSPAYGGKPVQLRPLDSTDTPVSKPGGGVYYPIDTASAHFDSSFGSTAVGGLSCTDCHDPHGSINKSMLQDFEEAKEQKDYNRDGIMAREIQYLDKENVRLYQLNEEKFCYFCHNGRFNTTGVNPPGSIPGDPLYWKMKDIESKFAYQGAHHMVDDVEQDANDVRIECTNCHNPHTAKRDAVVLNPLTGQRAYVTATVLMNTFCVGCHGDSTISNVIPTTWDEGIKFPGSMINRPVPEWTGNLWNKFNKQSMTSGNKHFQNVECAACHDPHGTSNYRLLSETVLNRYTALGGSPSSPSTTNVYGLQLMLQPKPDGRKRYEVYSTTYGTVVTNYSINRFCFGCHNKPYGYDPDYASSYIYPGETCYSQWDFGVVDSSSQWTNFTKYDSIMTVGGAYKYIAPDVYGKDKDCDYCHNPHGSDSTRIRMVRDNVPQDLDRNSQTFGDRVDSAMWFQDGYPATGVDFCLSRGCHVTNRFAKLGPRDPNYVPGGMSTWWTKPYDQFNLLTYGTYGALPFSSIRPGSFKPDGIAYTTARASKHPIMPYDDFINQGNTLICLSCHTPHGSPGNTGLAASYGSNYESTYPQDAAGLRRAYYRRIYWWPVTFWKRSSPADIAIGHAYGGTPSNNQFANFANFNYDYDVNTLLQNDAYYSLFVTRRITTYYNLYGTQEMHPDGAVGTENPMRYGEKVFNQNIPSAGNDLCYMCHPMPEIAGATGWPETTYIGIDTTKTRFVGHEAVIGGSKIGETKFGTGSSVGNMGLNLRTFIVRSDFHKFTCSMCHGPHAATNEKLLTNKCYAYNFRKPPTLDTHGNDVDNRGRPSVYCHPYDNTGPTNWNYKVNWKDTEPGTTFVGWRNMVDTTKMDFDRPPNSIDTLFVYFNTTGVYDTNTVIPGLSNLYVTSSDFDVVLAWRSVYDSTRWIDHYNVYRGETTLTQANKAYKTNPPGVTIKTWPGWNYSFVSRIYDSNLTRPTGEFNTLYTIDPSFAHTLGKKYYYIVAPADSFNNEALTPNCQDTAGSYYTSTNTVAPRPVTALSLTQETYDSGGFNFKMRFIWQDPGDNIATKNYSLYYKIIDTAQFNPSYSSLSAYLTDYIVTVTDTSFNTDIISAINFGDYYVTTHANESTMDSDAVVQRKVYVLGIKPADNQNNTASLYSIKYIRIADPVPSMITDLKARPDITANLTDTTNNRYNVRLEWSVPWDNAQSIESASIPIYKIYRKLNDPINQIELNTYNLIDTALTTIENIAVLTAYNSVALSQYNFGNVITYTDNVEPNKVYYYAVTSIDKYATAAANLADTVYGYTTDRAGRLYREQILPGYNTKLLSPLSSKFKTVKSNTSFRFSFNEATYETAYFKEYRFYERFETDRAWRFNSTYFETAMIHATTSVCWTPGSGCHDDRLSHGDTSECRVCHQGNARGRLDIDTTYPVGTYYFAGSIVYNSVRIIIDGRPATVNNLESPLNEIASLTVYDLIPPSPFNYLNYTLVPERENGYDSVRLSWSGGRDTTNFQNYIIKYRPEMAPYNQWLSSSWVTQDTTVINTYQTTWTALYPTPDSRWQSSLAQPKYGDFIYRYEIQAWDSDYNYSSISTQISTRPPSGVVGPGFNLQGLAGPEIRLSWTNMYNLSYGTDYSATIGGYKLYAKETAGTIDHIFYGTTLNIDTAYGINLIKTMTPILDTTAWPQGNQALNCYVTASSNQPYASNANDGSLASLWLADAYDTFSTTYIMFDLGARKEIATITYNNSIEGISFAVDSTDSSQGYTILVADTNMVWETVVSKPVNTPRGEVAWPRTGALTPIQYIMVTNFSSYATDNISGAVTELKANYPSDTTTTVFNHANNNPLFKALIGRRYAYGIYLEDTTSAKSRSAFTGSSYLVQDINRPYSVIDLAAYGSGKDNYIRLKWSKPYDDSGGIARYEVWRREDNPDIVDNNGYDFNKNVRLSSTYTTEFYTDTSTLSSSPYWYAICAVDSTGNRSLFAGKNYSVSATKGKNKDTTPPEPTVLQKLDYRKVRDGGPDVTLGWKSTKDKKDYDTLGQEDTTLYPIPSDSTIGISIYSIYKVDYALDSTPFANELELLGRNTFNSGYSTTLGVVADGWKAGTWGSTNVLASIDSTLSSPAQKLNIYNYNGDPNEQITANPKYVRSAAYLKTTGYTFETSRYIISGMETATTHYIFGLWLKAEGQFVAQYPGNVYVDIATKLNSGNESTYTLIARRTIKKPGYNWKYYILNFVTPTSGLDSTNENGIMIWGNNDGNIWMDSARLTYLGRPTIRKPETTTVDMDVSANQNYVYAVTAVDYLADNNPDDGFIYDGNEGDFESSMMIGTDEREPYFDSAYESIWDSTPWLMLTNPARVFKTGTTPTISFMEGATPTDYVTVQYGGNGLIFDSDNIFKNGDFVSFKMKIMDPVTNLPDTTILQGIGFLYVDYSRLDVTRWGVYSPVPLGDGEYKYYFRISTDDYLYYTAGIPQLPDTPYNTATGMYESLSKIVIYAVDKMGNGPYFDDTTGLDTTDNNPDTTYRCILDNEVTDAPGSPGGEEP